MAFPTSPWRHWRSYGTESLPTAKHSRRGETSSGSARGAERTYSELGGLAGGGMWPKLPPMPSTGMRASRPAPAQPLLVLRLDTTVGKDTRTAWVASVQCQMEAARCTIH